MTEANAKPAAPSSVDAATSSLPVARDPAWMPPTARIGLVEATLAALRFYTRLPVPVLGFERAPHAALDLSRAVATVAVAIAGAVLASVGSATVYLAATAGLPSPISALLGLSALVLASGALHEDGLADMADSLGGGSRERRLEIMRDSRIGSYGVVALVLSLALRATALAVLVERAGAAGAALALIAVASVSRVAGLLPLLLLNPARTDGAAAAVRAPTLRSMTAAAAIAAAIAAVALWGAGLAVTSAVVASSVAFVMSWVMTRIARTTLGGHTGDVAGAAQQLAEIGMLLALVLAVARF